MENKMLLPSAAIAANHWATVINFIIQHYFLDQRAICILWHKQFNLQLQTESTLAFVPVVNIFPETLALSFAKDIYNFTATTEEFEHRNLGDDPLEKKLKVAIEHTHCDSFIAFQDHIPRFSRAFRNASIFSLWRSQSNMFLFIFSKDLQAKNVDYFQDELLLQQPNILVIEASFIDSTIFSLKSNKFVGPLRDSPQQLLLLNYFDALTNSLKYPENIDFTQNKLQNLQGREIILGAFDCRPFVVVDFNEMPQLKDHALDNPTGTAFVDGTEVRILHYFCELSNCTVEYLTTQEDWGYVYPNNTGFGLLGMIADGRIHIALGAYPFWYNFYQLLDLTHYIGRSSAICVVPAPQRLIAWTLPIKPFQISLWLGVGVCLLVEIFTLPIARQIEEHISTALKLFVSQSSNDVPLLDAVRILLFAYYIVDMIVTSLYGGGLAAVLTLPTLSDAADTLERLWHFNLKWTGSTDLWVESLLNSTEPMIRDVVNNFRVHSFDEMRELAKTANMGFVLERTLYGHFGNAEYLTEAALDRLKLMHDDIYYEITTAFVPRLCPLLSQYNQFISAWHEGGFSKYWEWRIVQRFLNIRIQNLISASKYSNALAGPVQLDLQNFVGLAIIWIFGMSLSILCFAIELWWHRQK